MKGRERTMGLNRLNRLITARRCLNSNDQGLTLIEGLVAIVVIAASVAVITPAVVVSVATRLQNQRAEQAFQIAESEVNRVKLVFERGGSFDLNIATVAASTASVFEAEVPAPEDVDIATYSTTSTSAKPIDIDSDGVNDYAAQIFRSPGSTVGTTPVAFDLGVRIYRADTINDFASTALSTEQAQLLFTSSAEGQANTRPLAVIYTSVVKSDSDTSLCDYHNFLNDTTGRTISTPSQC